MSSSVQENANPDESGDDDILRQAELLAISMQSLSIASSPAGSKSRAAASSSSSKGDHQSDDSSMPDDIAVEYMMRKSQALTEKLHQSAPDADRIFRPAKLNDHAKPSAKSVDDSNRQAELLAISMQSLDGTEATTDSKNNTSTSLNDASPGTDVKETSRESQMLLSESPDTDRKSISTIDTSNPIDSCAPIHLQTNEENNQELDEILEQADLMVSQMKSSVCTDASNTLTDNTSSIKENEKDIDAILEQAQGLSSQMKAASTTNSVPSDADQENDQLDAILDQAELLAAQMRSSGSNANSKSETDADKLSSSNTNDENQLPIDDLLRQAEILAAQMKVESRSVDSKSAKDIATPTVPLPSTPKEATGMAMMDTPTLIRETEAILKAADPKHPSAPSAQVMDTPALIRRTDAVLASSAGMFPAVAVADTGQNASPMIDKTKELSAQTQSIDTELRKEASKVVDKTRLMAGKNSERIAETPPLAPKKSLQESADLMERALTALKQASAECSTPTPPEAQTPTSVSIVPVTDEMSSVGSSSLFSSGGDFASPRDPNVLLRRAPKLGTDRRPRAPRESPTSETDAVNAVLEETRQMALYLEQMRSNKSLPAETDRPPLAPRATTDAENDQASVDAILDETRKMALHLEQVSGVGQSPNLPTEAVKEQESSSGTSVHSTRDGHESNTAPEPLMKGLTKSDHDDNKVQLSDAPAVAASTREIDPCSKFEQRAAKNDPSAKYVKIVTASVGDSDYVPIVDYSQKKSRALPTHPSPPPYPSRKEKMRKIAFGVAVALLVLFAVMNCKTMWLQPVKKDTVAANIRISDFPVHKSLREGRTRQQKQYSPKRVQRIEELIKKTPSNDLVLSPNIKNRDVAVQDGQPDKAVAPMGLSSKAKVVRKLKETLADLFRRIMTIVGLVRSQLNVLRSHLTFFGVVRSYNIDVQDGQLERAVAQIEEASSKTKAALCALMRQVNHKRARLSRGTLTILGLMRSQLTVLRSNLTFFGVVRSFNIDVEDGQLERAVAQIEAASSKTKAALCALMRQLKKRRAKLFRGTLTILGLARSRLTVLRCNLTFFGVVRPFNIDIEDGQAERALAQIEEASSKTKAALSALMRRLEKRRIRPVRGILTILGHMRSQLTVLRYTLIFFCWAFFSFLHTVLVG